MGWPPPNSAPFLLFFTQPSGSHSRFPAPPLPPPHRFAPYTCTASSLPHRWALESRPRQAPEADQHARCHAVTPSRWAPTALGRPSWTLGLSISVSCSASSWDAALTVPLLSSPPAVSLALLLSPSLLLRPHPRPSSLSLSVSLCLWHSFSVSLLMRPSTRTPTETENPLSCPALPSRGTEAPP